MTFISLYGQIWPYSLQQDGILYVDAKKILKTVFKYGQNFCVDITKHTENFIKEERHGGALWVEIGQFEQYLDSKKNAECATNEVAHVFVWGDFKDALYDVLYDLGYTSYISNRRKIANENAAKKIANENAAKVLHLELENENLKIALRDIELAEIETAKKQFGFRLVQFFHNPMFPLLFALGMMVVLGAFSVHICAELMGIEKQIAVGYAIIFEFFPLMCALWAFKFEMPFKVKGIKAKIDPLWVTMIVHTLFILYHVGVLDSEYEGYFKINPVLAMGFIVMPPFMQKTAMGLIVKISNIYRLKGWLKITE